jgi:hypothetical protein
MRDADEWVRTTCLITDFEEDQGTNSSGVRDRLFFKVNFLDVLAGVATVKLDAWTSPAVAEQDLAKYPVGNTTNCFCPLKKPNAWGPKGWWSIYKFCIFDMEESEISQLVYYFNLWFYSSIACFCVAPIMMGVSIFIWAHTKCFKKRIRLWKREKYQPLN